MPARASCPAHDDSVHRRFRRLDEREDPAGTRWGRDPVGDGSTPLPLPGDEAVADAGAARPAA